MKALHLLPGKKGKRWGLWIPSLFILFTVLHGFLYNASIPPWQGPDEPRHYEYVRLLHDKGHLVDWGDADPKVQQAIILSLDQNNFWKWGASVFFPNRPNPLPQDFAQVWPRAAHELHQPPLPYLVYLVPLALLADRDIVTQLYGMRLVSLLLNVAIVLAAYVTGRELFPEDKLLALSIPIFVMLLPQHTFLLSTVNNDHLAEAALAWSFPILVRIIKGGVSLPRIIGLALLIAVAGAAKRTALVGVPISLVALVIYAIARRRPVQRTRRQWSLIAGEAIFSVSLIGIIALGAWRWVSSMAPETAAWFLHIFLFLPSEQFPSHLDAGVLSGTVIPASLSYLRYLFVSTWGYFGWMDIPLDVRAYWFFAALSGLALLGLFRFGFHTIHGSLLSSWQRQALFVFGGSILIQLFIVLAYEVRLSDLGWGGDAQGRYLFPVLIPIATLFLVGTREFISKRFHTLWFGAVVGGMVLFDAVALFGYIRPFYV